MTNLEKLKPLALVGGILLLTGCGAEPKQSSQALPLTGEKPIAVDVAIAKVENLGTNTEYIGATAPMREVAVRARTEGQLTRLEVELGDAVTQGQVIGLQDDGILRANLLQAVAELAARQAEVARAVTQVSNAKTQVERARLELQQAQADARRLQQLASDGVIAQQTAEQALTNANTLNQALRSSQAQLRSQENEVSSAQKRVQAQIAVINQARERLSYTNLTAPISGIVLQKISDAGNLLQPGNEVVRLGDFRRVKVLVQVSELERSQLRPGQPTTIRLDAFPQQSFSGQINRISAAADPTSRLIPVEVEIPNPNQQIGSGLLARVIFTSTVQQNVTAPVTALQVTRGQENQIFVLKGNQVEARPVEIGARSDGKVAILSGLAAGEQFVTRSSRPLKDGDNVVLSALSERVSNKN